MAREVISATRKKKTVKKRASKPLQKPGIFTNIRPFLNMSMVLKAYPMETKDMKMEK